MGHGYTMDYSVHSQAHAQNTNTVHVHHECFKECWLNTFGTAFVIKLQINKLCKI